MRLLQKLRNAFKRVTGGSRQKWITEEEDLANSLAELDATNPGWDDDLRVNGAVRRLENGTKRDVVLQIFSEETVKAAEERIAAKQPKDNGPAI